MPGWGAPAGPPPWRQCRGGPTCAPRPLRPCRRGAISSHTQAMEEIVLVEKVLAHLVKREQAVVVVEQPERAEGEAAADFGKRVQVERVLALNPNYSGDS